MPRDLLSRINVMQCNGLLQMPVTPFYVYKLTYNPEGYYYFGQTGDLRKRTYSHLHEVILAIEEDKQVKNRFYDVCVKDIKLHFQNQNMKLTNFVSQQFTIDLVAVFNSRDHACYFESYCIILHRRDPLNFNIKT